MYIYNRDSHIEPQDIFAIPELSQLPSASTGLTERSVVKKTEAKAVWKLSLRYNSARYVSKIYIIQCDMLFTRNLFGIDFIRRCSGSVSKNQVNSAFASSTAEIVKVCLMHSLYVYADNCCMLDVHGQGQH